VQFLLNSGRVLLLVSHYVAQPLKATRQASQRPARGTVVNPPGNLFPVGQVVSFFPEITMQQSCPPKSSTGFNPRSVDARHLHQMFERVDDVVVARLLLAGFNDNADLAKAFPGVLLRAQETVKRSHIRYAKARRYGVLARTCGGIAIDLVATLVGAVQRAGRATASAVRGMQRRAAYKKLLRERSKVVRLSAVRGEVVTDVEARVREAA
jgi:hypothetical protein